VTCNEWRRDWLDGAPLRETNADWQAHRFTCADCSAWERRQEAFDAVVSQVLFVAPPAELGTRLASLPWQLARARWHARPVLESAAPLPLPGQSTRGSLHGALDLTLLIMITLAAVGMAAFVLTFVAGLVLPWLQNLLSALPFVFNPVLVSAAEDVAATAVQAFATLMLLGLVLLQVERSASRPLGER
jgi:YD repeat-containing protein